MRNRRWLVGLGALLIAGLALYVLTLGKPPTQSTERTRPAMDEIDEKSRAAMRELLRETGEE